MIIEIVLGVALLIMVLLFFYQRKLLKQSIVEHTIIKALYIETCWGIWRYIEKLEGENSEMLEDELLVGLGQLTGYYEYLESNQEENT